MINPVGAIWEGRWKPVILSSGEEERAMIVVRVELVMMPGCDDDVFGETMCSKELR